MDKSLAIAFAGADDDSVTERRDRVTGFSGGRQFAPSLNMEARDVLLRPPGEDGALIDVLDRVLDKGIVIDAWARMSVAGIDLIGLKMNVVVASIETYLAYAEVLGLSQRKT